MSHQETDKMVNHPPHYNQGKIECIEAIYSATREGAEHYLQGNIIKYIWRYKYRHGLQDLKKAQWYLNALIDRLTKELPVDTALKEKEKQEEKEILAQDNVTSENVDINAHGGRCSCAADKSWVCFHQAYEDY